MKKPFALFGILTICFVSAYAQQSLLSEATNGLFTNVNDWIIRPNSKFNTVSDDHIIISSAFSNPKSAAKPQGGAELGYFHAGAIPFGISLGLDFISDKHLTETKTVTENTKTTVVTKYENPAFNDWDGTFRFTAGVPEMADISVGLMVNVKGSTNNAYKTVQTTVVNGAETKSVTTEYKKSSFDIMFSIPFGFRVGPVYNYLSPSFFLGVLKTEGSGVTRANDNSFSFFIYDKAVFFSLIPGGSETAVWAGAGNSPVSTDETEIPAFGTASDKTLSGQAGISNRIDFSPLDSVSIVLNPKFYIDWLIGASGSYRMGYTFASDIGLYAQIAGLPVAVFFGMTPRLLFYHGETVDVRDEGSTRTTTMKYAERKLGTDILWSGRLGLSLLLPKNMTCDVTCNVNTGETLINLSAQMTIAL